MYSLLYRLSFKVQIDFFFSAAVYHGWGRDFFFFCDLTNRADNIFFIVVLFQLVVELQH